MKKPVSPAVCFKIIRRCLIGALLLALRKSLPSWALSGIGLVEGPVLEIVSDKHLKGKLVDTLKSTGKEEIIKFDVQEGGSRKGT